MMSRSAVIFFAAALLTIEVNNAAITLGGGAGAGINPRNNGLFGAMGTEMQSRFQGLSNYMSNAGTNKSNGGLFDITIPSLAGSAFSVKSTGPSKSIGGSVSFEENGIKIPVQLGPAGGVQAEIVLPILPSIPQMLKLAEKCLGVLGGALNTILNQAANIASLVVNDVLNLLNKVGVNLDQLVKKAGDLVNAAIKAGAITTETAREIVASVLQSALSDTVNALATLIDLLQAAIKQKILLEQQAITLLADAVKEGAYKVENAANWSVETFLENAAKANKITEEVAYKLKELLRSTSANVETTTEATTITTTTTSTTDSNSNSNSNTNSITDKSTTAAAVSTSESTDNERRLNIDVKVTDE